MKELDLILAALRRFEIKRRQGVFEWVLISVLLCLGQELFCALIVYQPFFNQGNGGRLSPRLNHTQPRLRQNSTQVSRVQSSNFWI